MKNKGFISTSLIYSFLILFLFLMISIINCYSQKNTFFSAINDRISNDLNINKTINNTFYNSLIKNNFINNISDSFINNSLVSSNGFFLINDSTISNKDIYVFRGNIYNNYVVLGKNNDNKSICWKIVRTNEDKSIRLAYYGIYNDNNKSCEKNMLSKSKTTVPYASSELKTKINDWVSSVQISDELLIDEVFCDKTNEEYSFECPNNKLFLDNKVGSLSITDVIYSGGYTNKANNYYLNYEYKYWTMSGTYYVDTTGQIIEGAGNEDDVYIVPVINVSGRLNVESGIGLYNNPYIVK